NARWQKSIRRLQGQARRDCMAKSRVSDHRSDHSRHVVDGLLVDADASLTRSPAEQRLINAEQLRRVRKRALETRQIDHGPDSSMPDTSERERVTEGVLCAAVRAGNSTSIYQIIVEPAEKVACA